MNYIKSINWTFTYKCNLKCKHCDIWDNKFKDELPIEKIKEIVTSKTIQDSFNYHSNLFDIAISGGEPLLIGNLKEIIIVIDNYVKGSIHTLSTNGILKEKLIDLLLFLNNEGKQLKKINISIDGKEKNHDLQRGIDGSFRKSIDTIQTVKKLFPKLLIEIKLTITKDNYKDILFFSKLANKLGVFFSFKPVENMLNYTNQKGAKDITFTNLEIDEIENQIFNNPYIIEQNYYINKNFFYLIPNYLRKGLGDANKICDIAKNSITIMPDGQLYSCNLMNKIGNIYDNSIDSIWNGELIKNQRINIENGKCPGCMLMCGSFKTKKIFN